MQYKVYARQTLNLADTGYVIDYTIDNDYLIMNNSIINISKPTEALQGDIIALIKISGAYSLGCITSIDNKALTISYKPMNELFNDNILNPLREYFKENELEEASYEAITTISALLLSFNNTEDKYKQLKIKTETSGKYENAAWNYTENQVNLMQYFIDCFDRYNIVLQYRLSFEKQGTNIIIKVIRNMNTGDLLKDNIKLQSLTFTEEQQNVNTVAIMIDSEDKSEIARYYLLTDNTITDNINNSNRLLPVKTTVVEYNQNQTTEKIITIEQAAQAALIGQIYNHYIESVINKNSRMLDFNRLIVGNAVTVVSEPVVKPVNENDPTSSTIDTIYTGFKENSKSNMVTLIFGKARKNYTDKIQLLLRKGVNR